MERIVIWAQKHAFMVHLVITSSKEELTFFLFSCPTGNDPGNKSSWLKTQILLFHTTGENT